MARRTHKSAVGAIGCLKGVTSVRLCFNSMSNPIRSRAILKKTLPLIHSTLQCYTENLALLSITVPLVEMPDLLPPFLILPRLKILHIFFEHNLKAAHDPVGNILATSLLPFVNNYTQTLEEFRFAVASALDMAPLFKGLRCLPNLKTTTFQLTEETEGYHIRTFIHQHSHTLRDITILTHNPEGPASSFDSIARLLFEIQTAVPDLQHLRIVFGGHLGSLSNLEIPTQLAFSSNSLLTLKLMNQELDFAAISSFLLSDTNDFQRLRTLAIEISEFTPVVLDLLAERLVSLHNLELTTQFFQPTARNFMVGLNDISRIQMASVQIRKFLPITHSSSS